MIASAIAILITFLVSFFGSPAMDNDPAPAPAPVVVHHEAEPESPTWGEVPILPEPAYAPPADCTPVPVDEGEIDEDARTYLLDTGWTGHPGDGMEALYPPGC